LTYCIAPDDKNILKKLTQQLPLSAAAQFVLNRSQVDSIAIDPQTGNCQLILHVPKLLAEQDVNGLPVFCRK
jgi:hypothetical protein